MDPSKLAATAKWLNEDSSTTLCANTTIIPQVDSLELNGDLSLQLSSQHNSVDKGNHKSDTNSHLHIVDLDSLKDGTHEAFLETTHLHGFSFIHTAGFRWEAVFCTVVVIIFGAFLLRDSVLLIFQYMDVPMSAEVN